MKKALLFIVNSVLAVIAVLLTIAVFIQVVMTAAILWLGSSSGQAWLTTNIGQSLKDSGYTVNLTGLTYHSLQGLVADNIVIGDKGGEIFRARRVMAHLALLPLLDKHASISLKVTDGVLSRLPESQASTEPEAQLQPFALPDIYINSVSASLSANSLLIKAPVAGQDLTLIPDFKGTVHLTDGKINADAMLALGQSEQKIMYLPDTTQIKGVFDPQALSLSLENMKLSASSYSVEASGSADLKESGSLDLKLSAQSDDLAPVAGQAGKLDMQATLTGSMDKPLLNADGKLDLEMLKAQGLGEVALTVSTALENGRPLGHAVISTTYQDIPAKLEADYEYNDPVLSLVSIAGTAPDLEITGATKLDVSSLLADGQIDIKASKLETYAKLMGIELKGSATAQAVFNAAESKQSVAAEIHVKNGQYETMSAASIDASAVLPDVTVPWPKALDVKASKVVLTPDTTLNSVAVKLSETGASAYHADLDIAGQAMKAFQLKGGADIALIENKPDVTDINLNLTSTGASVNVTGKASEQALDLKAELKNLTSALVPAELPESLQSVSASGDIVLTGSAAQPVIAAALDFSTLKIKDTLPAIKIAATGGYQSGVARVDLTGSGQGIRTLAGGAELPLTLSLYPFAFDLSDAAPLKGTANFDLSGTTLLATILPPEHKFTGDLKGNATIAGTMATPQASGTINVNGATYLYEPYGVGLQNLTLQADISESEVRIAKLSATDGENGTLLGSGSVDLKNPQGSVLSLKLENYHLLKSRTADGTIGADLSLKGQGEGYLLGGAIKLGAMNIVIPEQFESKIPELNIITDKKEAGPSKTLQAIALNLNIIADNQIFVRGWGLDAEFGGTIAATGTLDDPQLNGELSSKRGRYEEFGKRFTLAKSVLRFQGSVPPSPYLDIEAQTNAGDVVASVLLTGPVTKPQIKFASVPALPEDEVLSRILFGRNMDRITPFQAVQLTQTLQRFSGKGGGGLDPLGTLRNATGLDDISVDTDEAGETSVGVGKYLTDKVYLQLEKGKGDASGAASVQIEVTPSVNVESKIGQDAQAGGGIFWKHDY